MFKKNKRHEQLTLFKYDESDIDDLFTKAESTEEGAIYNLLFSKIDEEIFKDVYCTDNGRPNSAINAMVTAMILRNKRDWSYVELFNQLTFNITARMAIGVFHLCELPFNEATLFNFQNRVKEHYEKTNINLFEKVFDSLTKEQLKALKIKTNIARTDSVLINSNIKKYGHLELLIEIALRMYRIFSDPDKALFCERFKKYTEQTSQHYLYDLKGSDLTKEFEDICEVYYWIKSFATEKYSSTPEYKNFARAFEENFKLDESEKPVLKEKKELSSSSIQSPDDPDATYRHKNGKSHYGQLINVTETANPENKLNLITDVAVAPNNRDDSKVLNDRVEPIVEKMQDLDEIHVDGGFGGISDAKLTENGVKMIQTAIRSRKAEVKFTINQIENKYKVTCSGGQEVESIKTRSGKRSKVTFDSEICLKCPHFLNCPAQKGTQKNVFYFNDYYYIMHKRHNNINEIPAERRKIRSNVEATINEFVCKTKDHKIRVRGFFETCIFAFTTAIAINFGRIFRADMKMVKC